MIYNRSLRSLFIIFYSHNAENLIKGFQINNTNLCTYNRIKLLSR